MSTAADLVERSVSETLTYYAFPDIHWQKIRTNNPLERIMRESTAPHPSCWGTHPVKAQGVRIVHRGQAASAARFCGRQFQGSRSAIRLAG